MNTVTITKQSRKKEKKEKKTCMNTLDCNISPFRNTPASRSLAPSMQCIISKQDKHPHHPSCHYPPTKLPCSPLHYPPSTE